MYHTILNTTKGLYGFGYNDYEQLGLCDIKSANLPIKLKFFNDMEIVSVSCGGYHTIVNTINGLFVFGSNEYGQLGLGYSDFNICVPTKIDSFIEEDCCPKYIERVYLDVVEIVSVSCGENHTIIRTTDGLYSCGHNDFGQLGLGDVGDKNIPMKLEFFDSLEIISISCGADHTLINTNNGLYGFGDNSYEQLGLKDTLYVYVPTKLDFFHKDFSFEIIDISCGCYYTLINTTGGLYSCGYNEYGELGLGLGDSEYATVPTKSDFFKVGVFEIISISCGNNHTIINTTDGLYVFGSNVFGQLGLCNIRSTNVPKKLKFFNNVDIFFVYCYGNHTIINTRDGLYSFGANEYGQLGLGDNDNRLIPTKLDTDFEIITKKEKRIKSTNSFYTK